MSTHELPDELSETAGRLRSERPELDAHGLDRVHGRIVGRALRPARRSRQSLAITLCLAFGLVFTGAGSSLAISGMSSDRSAAQAQYGGQQIAGDQDESLTIGDEDYPERGTKGANAGSDPAGTAGANASGGDQAVRDQAVRQVQATGSARSLPFTGSASLFILGLGGVLLLTGGALLRRRTARGHDI